MLDACLCLELRLEQCLSLADAIMDTLPFNSELCATSMRDEAAIREHDTRQLPSSSYHACMKAMRS